MTAVTDTMSTLATGSAPLRDLRTLPKGHLHLHMEASVRPATLASMAAAIGIAAPETTVFSGFTQFDVVYRTLLAVLQEPEHLARLIDEIQMVVSPIILGGGRSPFAGVHALGLTLRQSRRFANGKMFLTYAPAAG